VIRINVGDIGHPGQSIGSLEIDGHLHQTARRRRLGYEPRDGGVQVDAVLKQVLGRLASVVGQKQARGSVLVVPGSNIELLKASWSRTGGVNTLWWPCWARNAENGQKRGAAGAQPILQSV